MNQVIQKLKEGDLRQKGKSEEVVADVLKKPQLFQDLVAGISDAEPGVRMRASDALEKITRSHPEFLLRTKTISSMFSLEAAKRKYVGICED